MNKTLLLHTCCAPCLTQCLQVLLGLDKWEKALKENPCYDIIIYYDNPNIYPPEEFDKRKAEIIKLLGFYNQYSGKMQILKDFSDLRRQEWLSSAAAMKNEPERGKRCAFCYEFRLETSFQIAQKMGYTSVATTLTLSPMKDTLKINEIGTRLSGKYKIPYIVSDFKKNDGFNKSIELCRKYGIYRQNYCGCEFSLRNHRFRTILSDKNPENHTNYL